MSESYYKERVKGVILGQAIGDALGHPAEFNKHLVVNDLPHHNEFTDDTQMMLAIAESLISAPPENGTEPFMEAITKNFVRWAFSQDNPPWGRNDRSPGGACMSGCHALKNGKRWDIAGGLTSKGNGSAMRASVIGAAYWQDPDFAWKIGCLTSLPTHANLEAILCSGFVAYVVALSVAGAPLSVSVASGLTMIERWEDTVDLKPSHYTLGSGHSDSNPWKVAARLGAAFAYGRSGKDAPTPGEFRRWNGDDFHTLGATAAALFYNARYNNYNDIVLGLVNNTGDCDTTAAIGGAMAGARFGYSFIPSRWRAGVERSAYLHDVAERIWKLSIGQSQPDTEVTEVRT